jgi:hypothetical protein
LNSSFDIFSFSRCCSAHFAKASHFAASSILAILARAIQVEGMRVAGPPQAISSRTLQIRVAQLSRLGVGYWLGFEGSTETIPDSATRRTCIFHDCAAWFLRPNTMKLEPRGLDARIDQEA